MPKSNKLHKRHLVIRYGITYNTTDKSMPLGKPDEVMTMEVDIPRRWANKDIFGFADSHIGRRGRTDSGKDFRVQKLLSVDIQFPDDENREIKLLRYEED